NRAVGIEPPTVTGEFAVFDTQVVRSMRREIGDSAVLEPYVAFVVLCLSQNKQREPWFGFLARQRSFPGQVAAAKDQMGQYVLIVAGAAYRWKVSLDIAGFNRIAWR